MDSLGTSDERLSELEFRLLDEFQRDFPLCSRPYAVLAKRLGSDEETIIRNLAELRARGYISRVGAVVTPHKAGWSTLAAMSVPEDRLTDVAQKISVRGEVNHNYEREHEYNLWFVVTGTDRNAVAGVLMDIEAETGMPVIDLPLVEAYRLDLGFRLS